LEPSPYNSSASRVLGPDRHIVLPYDLHSGKQAHANLVRLFFYPDIYMSPCRPALLHSLAHRYPDPSNGTPSTFHYIHNKENRDPRVRSPAELNYQHLSLDTAGSLEEVVCARTPGSKQRVYLYRIQLITPPPCLPIVLELVQTLFRRLNITFLQIESRKNPALSPSHCPNSNLSILTIGTTMAHQTYPPTSIHTILLSYSVCSLQMGLWISL
jgi:hypothetical protein